MGAGETCADYAQAGTGGGYVQSGEEPITISGIGATESIYTAQQSGDTDAQYIVPLESNLIGCARLQAIVDQSTTDHATIDRIFRSIEIHPSK